MGSRKEDVIDEVATAYYQAGSMMLQLQTIRKSIDNLKEMHRIADLSYLIIPTIQRHHSGAISAT